MNYALIESGVVINLLWLYPDSPGAPLNAVPCGDLPVRIGDSFDGLNFYRDGKLLLTNEQYQNAAARAAMDAAAAMLTDDQAVSVLPLFRLWAAGEQYAAGDRRTYEGVLYRCITAHVSQDSWTPQAASSLWAKVLTSDTGEALPWEQPESTNPYNKGDKVTHNGKTWISDIDGNVWEPGVHGWSEVVE